MPLVVPGLSSNGGDAKDQTSHWTTQLMGKKIGDDSNETTFAKKDLPQNHRVVKGGDAMTMDFKPDRLNIHTDDDGTVKKITHG